MLEIIVPKQEMFNENTLEFMTVEERVIKLEHSLVSISKWESIYCKPFLSKEEKTEEEILEYIKCMTITQNVPPETYLGLSYDNFREIKEYIDSDMTATTFNDRGSHKSSKEIMTSEIIYYQMITLGIPMECQKWHLNRLLTLIRVCAIKNSPQKKMSAKEVAAYNRRLNDMRRKQTNTKG